MKTIQIPKGSGGFREVCCPSPKRKAALRREIPRLQHIVRQVCDLNIVHGFAELRSPVTNARKHVRFIYTLSMDLKDFFDSVNFVTHFKTGNVIGPASKSLFYHGVAKQGLPTSPILANIAAAPMDKEILALDGGHDAGCADIDLHFTYSRYADDLTFSFNSLSLAEVLTRRVTEIAAKYNFTVNPAKTTLQDATRGRRIITGVAVDDKGIYPTRATKRKLRAARSNLRHELVKVFPRRQWTKYKKTCAYHGRKPMPKGRWLRRWLWQRVKGLAEWCALKPPKHGRRSAERIEGLGLDGVEEIVRLAERHVYP